MAEMNLSLKISADAKAAQDALRSIQKSIKDAGDETSESNKKTRQMWSSFLELDKTMQTIAKGFGAYLGGRFILDIVAATRELEKQRNVLTNMLGSVTAANNKIEELRALSNRLGQDVSATTAGWIQFNSAIKGSSLTAADAQKVLAGYLLYASKIGLSADDTAGALRQLTQTISLNKFTYDNLQEIQSRGINIFGLLQDATGKSRAELQQLVEKGLLPANDALLKVFGTMDDGVTRSQTLEGNFNRLHNAWTQFLQGIDQSGILKDIIGTLADLAAAAGKAHDAIVNASLASSLSGGISPRLIRAAPEITPGSSTEDLQAFAAAYERQVKAVQAAQQNFNAGGLGPDDELAHRLRIEQVELARLATAYEKYAAAVNPLKKESAIPPTPDDIKRTQTLAKMEEQLQISTLTAQGKLKEAYELEGKALGYAGDQLAKYIDLRQKAVALDETAGAKQKSPAGRAFDELTGQGFSDAQAAGIVGNLQQESNLDPLAKGGKGERGIAQWKDERFDQLKKFAASLGKDWSDFGTQLKFITEELRTTERAALEKLLQETTPEGAAKTFATAFERASDPMMKNRTANARAVYTEFSKSPVGDLKKQFEDITKSQDEAAKAAADAEKAGFEQSKQDVEQYYAERKALAQSQAAYERQVQQGADTFFVQAQEEQKRFLDAAYQARLLKANDYYAGLQHLADAEYERTQRNIQGEIDAEEAKLSRLTKDSAEYYDQLTRVQDLQAQKAASKAQYRTTSAGITTAGTRAITGAGSKADGGLEAFANQFDQRLGDMSQIAFSAANSMQTAFATFFESGLAGTQTLQQAFINMIRSMTAQILAFMTMKALVGFLRVLGGGSFVGAAGGSAFDYLTGTQSAPETKHGGGLVSGPKGSERLIIAQAGEEVLTMDDPRHRYNRMPRYHTGGIVGMVPNTIAPVTHGGDIISMPISVSVDNRGNQYSENQSQALAVMLGNELKKQAPSMIRQEMARQKRPGGLSYGS